MFRILLLALIVKLFGAVLRYTTAVALYGGPADASVYSTSGAQIAPRLRHGHLAGGLHSFSGTDFIRWVTGAVYALIGNTKIGGFVFFSWLGFLGLFLFYRAFTIGVPLGRRRSYAHLLFFLPSLVYWPSSIGKEAWMMFALGIAAYGIARILTGNMWRGLVFCLPGLWLAGIVRPHMAALFAVSLAAAVVTRKSKSELRELAPIVKGGSIVAIMILAAVLVVRTDRFLQKSGIDTNAGVTSALNDVQSRTSTGGASFVPSIVNSPARAPLAAVTVLFRPFVFEAHNLQSLLAAIEGTALMGFCLIRYRWGWATIRSLRQQPYVVFCFVFVTLFIVAYSSFSNFGLLTRERVQLYPLFLVLFSIPPRIAGGSAAFRSASEAFAV